MSALTAVKPTCVDCGCWLSGLGGATVDGKPYCDDCFRAFKRERREQTKAYGSLDKFRDRLATNWRSGDETACLPEPDPLIRGVLNFDSTNVIFGATGSYKTFIALDMALSVVTGEAWHGNDTTEAQVIYVLLEGAGFVSKRIAAWQQHHGFDYLPWTWHLITTSVPIIDDASRGEFVRMVREAAPLWSGPYLFVFDTLSRILGSGDQNDNAVMQMAVDAGDRLNAEFEQAATLYVAHTGWTSSDHVRGGSAFQAGVSTALKVEADADAGAVTIKNVKQREDRKAADLRLRPEQVGDSMVLVEDDRSSIQRRGMTTRQQSKLGQLAGGPLTLTAWASACGVAKNSFARTTAQPLVEAGFVSYIDPLYRLTDAGRAELGMEAEAVTSSVTSSVTKVTGS